MKKRDFSFYGTYIYIVLALALYIVLPGPARGGLVTLIACLAGLMAGLNAGVSASINNEIKKGIKK